MKDIEAAIIGAMIAGRNSGWSDVDNIVESVEKMDRARGDKEDKGKKERKERDREWT